MWPAGIALAMDATTLVTPGVTVLEIGAGPALPSLVAAAKGASVVALDWAPEAIDLLRANSARNRLASVRALECEWSDLAAITAVQSELVFAADVLYEARNVEPVAAALAAGLARAGRALVADPGRTHAGRFAAAALQHGLELDAGLLPTLPRGVLFELRHGPSPPPPPQT
ncbi:MAG: methyltransferase domain-containing protein [Gaiella sp.]